MQAGAVDEMEANIHLSIFNKYEYALIGLEDCVNTQYLHYGEDAFSPGPGR